MIEHRGRMVITPASYSGDPGFKSWPGKQQSRLRFFVVLLSPSRQVPEQGLKLGHELFHPHLLLFIILIWPAHLTLYKLSC
jgi:hypothetical protein